MLKLDRTTKTILKNPSKRWAWIIYQLSQKDTTLAQLARENHVERQTLYTVKNNRYPKMQAIIANALGIAETDLWPERYDADALPIKQRGGAYVSCQVSKKREDNTTAKRRNVKYSRRNKHAS